MFTSTFTQLLSSLPLSLLVFDDNFDGTGVVTFHSVVVGNCKRL